MLYTQFCPTQAGLHVCSPWKGHVNACVATQYALMLREIFSGLWVGCAVWRGRRSKHLCENGVISHTPCSAGRPWYRNANHLPPADAGTPSVLSIVLCVCVRYETNHERACTKWLTCIWSIKEPAELAILHTSLSSLTSLAITGGDPRARNVSSSMVPVQFSRHVLPNLTCLQHLQLQECSCSSEQQSIAALHEQQEALSDDLKYLSSTLCSLELWGRDACCSLTVLSSLSHRTSLTNLTLNSLHESA